MRLGYRYRDEDNNFYDAGVTDYLSPDSTFHAVSTGFGLNLGDHFGIDYGFEYRFTEKGRELYAVMISLMRWGDRWLAGDGGAPLRLRHCECGHDFQALVVCSECRAPIQMGEISYKHQPGVRAYEDQSTAASSNNTERYVAGEA